MKATIELTELDPNPIFGLDPTRTNLYTLNRFNISQSNRYEVDPATLEAIKRLLDGKEIGK